MKTTFDEAIEAARTYFRNDRISRADVCKASKERKYVRLRGFIAAYMRASDPKKFSYPMIARFLKYSDHTSVMNVIGNAHAEWGERLFVKLAGVKPVEAISPEGCAQEIHSPTYENLIEIGEANLARFRNGKGWERVA